MILNFYPRFFSSEFWPNFKFWPSQLKFKIFYCQLFRQILSQISECSPQGKINCGASSEPKIIQNDFLLMHMLEFPDIHNKCQLSLKQLLYMNLILVCTFKATRMSVDVQYGVPKKVVSEFWFGHPKCHFRYHQNG